MDSKAEKISSKKKKKSFTDYHSKIEVQNNTDSLISIKKIKNDKNKHHSNSVIMNTDSDTFIKAETECETIQNVSIGTNNSESFTEESVKEELIKNENSIKEKKKKKRKKFKSNDLNLDTNDLDEVSVSKKMHKRRKCGFMPLHNMKEDSLIEVQPSDQQDPNVKETDVCTQTTLPSTISIAIPASILDTTCPHYDSKLFVSSQIARAAGIYSVDEIIIYNDNCWKSEDVHTHDYLIDMMKTILEYLECPQYLKKHLFSYNEHLSKIAILNPLTIPHHFKAGEWSQFREGVVLSTTKRSSMVDCGLSEAVAVAGKFQPHTRVTVQLTELSQEMAENFGKVVNVDEPRKAGTYWGYSVRLAKSLSQALNDCLYDGGYDIVIGTSDRGTNTEDCFIKKFEHALIVFGGVAGLEKAIQKDDDLQNKKLKHVFPLYLNTCPHQKTRTIRTEEAVLITLATLSPKLRTAAKCNYS